MDGSRGECFRGLEHGLHNNDEQSRPASSDKLMEDLPLGRSQKRKNILQAVLAQQRETKEMGLQDPKGLSVTSTHQTKWAKNRAITQAEKDFETACQIWMEEKQYCSKLLPSVLGPKMMEQIFRGHVFVADDTPESPEQRRATLEMVSQAVSSALAELEDMDELDF